jgi:hypothetical protein
VLSLDVLNEFEYESSVSNNHANFTRRAGAVFLFKADSIRDLIHHEKMQMARRHLVGESMSLYQAVEKITRPFLESQDIAKLPLQVGLLARNDLSGRGKRRTKGATVF